MNNKHTEVCSHYWNKWLTEEGDTPLVCAECEQDRYLEDLKRIEKTRQLWKQYGGKK